MNTKSQTKQSLNCDNKRILIYGCGYLGKEIGRQLVKHGTEVWGSTRSQENIPNLRNAGINPIISEWNQTASLRDLDSFTHLIIAVSRGRHTKKNHWDSLVLGLGNLLPKLSRAQHFVYISSTGVYHQSGGIWVDENSPTFPTRPSARAHLAAENLLRRFCTHQTWNILRLAGIYGPHRVPNRQQLLAGAPIQANPNSFLNLIHVEDAAQAAISALEKSDRTTYVISDDHPARRGDYYSFIAKRLKAPEPTYMSTEKIDLIRPRSEGNKRVWNRKMKKQLLQKLKYSTFKDGLAPLLPPRH